MSAPPEREGVPRIETLRVKNYRALRDIELGQLTPLTVLLGPNGSGKSTVFDVFAFLSECFTEGLRKAWDRRGRFRQMRTKGSEGPILIELQYREHANGYLITYHLEIDEQQGSPVVAREWMRWKRGQPAAPFHFLDYTLGRGDVVTGEMPEKSDERRPHELAGRDVLAVPTLGQLAENPRVSTLRRFITGWHLSYLSADQTRGNPEAGGEEKLSQTGDNLPNVIQHLKEQHPDRLDDIFSRLRERVPRLERFTADIMEDGRLLLQLKDAPFKTPVLARYASDGTLKLLAYLTLLFDPAPPPLVGVEEPENHLHPRLLPGLAEECQVATDRTQLLVTTHSPFFIDSLTPWEVRALSRDEHGHTRTDRVANLPGIRDFINEGASLGDLWMEGRFD